MIISLEVNKTASTAINSSISTYFLVDTFFSLHVEKKIQ